MLIYLFNGVMRVLSGDLGIIKSVVAPSTADQTLSHIAISGATRPRLIVTIVQPLMKVTMNI